MKCNNDKNNKSESVPEEELKAAVDRLGELNLPAPSIGLMKSEITAEKSILDGI